MNTRKLHSVLTYFIAGVWLINGLFCKVLGLVPRHELIVGRILGDAYAHPLTIIIGISEIIMALWVASGRWSRINSILQIMVVSGMNILEFFLVPDLLLWGKYNSLFAMVFILIVYYNEFQISHQSIHHS
jgi:hypothetical protein